jgi:hypothetical protein
MPNSAFHPQRVMAEPAATNTLATSKAARCPEKWHANPFNSRSRLS